MNKIVLVLSIALAVLLLATGVYAYQMSNRFNASVTDKTALDAAIESGNYTAWKELHANQNGRMVSIINESNFYLLQEMHEAMESNDFAKVQEIKTQLGFNSGNGKGQGKGMGMHNGQKNGNCPYAN